MGVNHFYPFDDRYLLLRFLNRAYVRLIHNLAVLAIHASDYQPEAPLKIVYRFISSAFRVLVHDHEL